MSPADRARFERMNDCRHTRARLADAVGAEARRVLGGLSLLYGPEQGRPRPRIRYPRPMRYRFADFELDTHAERLTRRDAPVEVQAQVADALRWFLDHPGQIVRRVDLTGALWPDVTVSPGSVDQVIWKLRRVLGDDARRPRLLETVPRRGFRFIGRVERLERVDGASSTSSFVGRDAEMAAVERAVERPGLVTLAGPGGCGKTRLAREFLAARAGGRFVEIAACRAPLEVVRAVAWTLGVPLDDADPVGQVGTALANRGAVLLVLDNLEQVDAAPVVGAWLAGAPDLRVLATSRRRVGLDGERVVSVGPLSAESARRLFRDRAEAARPGFDADDASLDAIAARFDHLPLAIELVAARAHRFGVADLVDLARRGRPVARASRPDARPPRHRTLDDLVAWSWDLLSGDARHALACATAFRAAFTVAALEAVADRDVTDAVEELCDASLCRAEVVDGAARLALFETVRDFARTHVPDEAYARHARWFGRLGADDARDAGHAEARAAVDDLLAAAGRDVPLDDAVRCALAAADALALSGPVDGGVGAIDSVLGRGPPPPLRARLLAARGRLLRLGKRAHEAAACLDEAVALHAGEPAQAARTLATLAAVEKGLGHLDVARRAVERGLALDPDLPALGELLAELGALLLEEGQTRASIAPCERALAIFRELGDRLREGRVLGTLGIALVREGRLDDGRRVYEASLAARREAGDRPGEAVQLTNLGHLHLEAGRVEQARVAYDHALAIHRAIGNRRSEAAVLVSLGVLHLEGGGAATARDLLHRALVVARDVRYPKVEAYALANLGHLDLEAGRPDEALRAFGAALELARGVGDRRNVGVLLGSVGRALTDLDRAPEALPVLDEGEAVLREVGDRFQLCLLLCHKASAEAARGPRPDATLAEIAALARALDLDPASALGRAVARALGRPA